MKTNLLIFPVLVLGVAVMAHAQAPARSAAPAASAMVPTKLAIINIQAAIVNTKDGQKAAAALQSKFNPRKEALQKRQNDVAALQDQLRKGSATMSDDAKAKLEGDIDADTKSLNRDAEDLNADVQQDQGKVMQDLGGKMMTIIEKYASENGFAVVLDVSNPQTPVLWAAASTNITADIVKLYDQAHPAAAGASAPLRPAAAHRP